MQLIYAMEPVPFDGAPSIFLAGPTPRSQDVSSWRPSAIDTLSYLGWNGIVFLPEDRSGVFHGDYIGQVEWEEEALRAASCIMFWVPRNLWDLPGFTTNDEWGYWKASGKVTWGAPPMLRKSTTSGTTLVNWVCRPLTT